MANLFHRLVEVLAVSTKHDLRRQVQYLKAENEILRRKIAGPVRIDDTDRLRLLRLGMPLGKSIEQLISIVKPETFARWVNHFDVRRSKVKRKPGRPRKAEEIRELVLRMARETGWGYTRILGELKKLGIKISRGTVINTLREAGLPTSPNRSESTWDGFLKAHAKTLWACDFVSRKVLTARGVVDAFFLIFIHVSTRRVWASSSTTRPEAAWVEWQVEEFAEATNGRAACGAEETIGEQGAASDVIGRVGCGKKDQETETTHRKMSRAKRHADDRSLPPCDILISDNDKKFQGPFRSALAENSIRHTRIPFRTPNMNAYAERFIQTLEVECLDKFIAMGTSHLDHLVREFVEHYNAERPHSGIGYRVPGRTTAYVPQKAEDESSPPTDIETNDGRERHAGRGRVRCKTRLGGVLKHYYRAAG